MGFYLYFIIAFLIGGIPFGLLAGYFAGQGDIRTKGSGNIGATNVWRVAGPGAAIFVFAGDIGKGVAAVALAHALASDAWPVAMPEAALIGGFGAVAGHLFSPFLRFRGGKGVNTALGVFISLMPVETCIAVGVFLFTVIVFRYISLGSMAAALSLAIILWLERLVLKRPVADVYVITGSVVALLIMFAHRGNIRRLIKGTESRFQLRKASG